MRIFVDQDEVLAQWGQGILDFWNDDRRQHGIAGSYFEGRDVVLEDIKTWDFAGSLHPDPRVANTYIRAYMRYPNFYQDLRPVPGAIEGMEELSGSGIITMIATAVPKQAGLAYEGKLQWCRKNIPFFDLDDMIGIKKKYRLCDGRLSNILLDDGIHNLKPWRDCGGTAVCFDRPWNQEWTGHRVKDWPQFVQFIKRFYKE